MITFGGFDRPHVLSHPFGPVPPGSVAILTKDGFCNVGFWDPQISLCKKLLSKIISGTLQSGGLAECNERLFVLG